MIYADFRRDGLRDAALASLEGWIGRPRTVRLAGHNLKEVLRLCPGPLCESALFDAMLVSYLLKPSVHGHSLDELALERLSRKPLTAKDAGWDKGQAPPVGDSRLAAYAAERVEIARRMAEAMRPASWRRAPSPRSTPRSRPPLVPVLLRMEEAGILLDVDYLKAMSVELGAELAELEEEIYKQAGETFNLNSPQQLGVILFEKMGLPALKKTQKTKSYSTGAETLEELARRGYPDRRAPAALPRADQAQVHLRRRPAGAGRRRTAASTPASTRRWPPPAGSPRPTRTCRTSRCAPSSGSASAAPSSRRRARCCWSPTTARSSCASSPTSPRRRR